MHFLVDNQAITLKDLFGDIGEILRTREGRERKGGGDRRKEGVKDLELYKQHFYNLRSFLSVRECERLSETFIHTQRRSKPFLIYGE